MAGKVVVAARRAAPRLDDTPLLREVLPGTRSLLARGAVIRHASAGTALFRAGDPVRGLVILLEGEVQVLGMREGRQYLVHRGAPGDTLGEVPLFAGGGYPATAMAETACSYAVLPLATLQRAMQSDPSLAFLLLGRLARRVRELVQRLERNTAWTVDRRLAEVLLTRQREGGPASFTLGRSQQALAEELGTVREVLVRALAGFCRAGWVRREGRARYRVVDPTALEALLL